MYRRAYELPCYGGAWDEVTAARIIHDQGEKMIYFEDARLEFFGKPIAWIPYFSTPDPTSAVVVAMKSRRVSI